MYLISPTVCIDVKEKTHEVLTRHSVSVDGVIRDWSEWSECSLTCGGGQRSRERECHGPFFGGAMCAEHLNETESCNQHPCPGW